MTTLSYFSDIQDQLAKLEDQVLSACTPHDPKTAGLDIRCGQIYVGEDFIASTRPRELDYYGGFEYVDSDYTLTIGPFLKVYSIEDERVASHMATLEHNCD